MRIVDFLAPDAVLVDVPAADKANVLMTVGRHLAKRAGLPAATVQAALTAREALGSTGIGRGVAIPHAWIAGLEMTHGVFARLARPVAFDAVDDAPVDLVCALVGPDAPGAACASALAAIARLLRDAGGVRGLRRAPTAEALYAILTRDSDGRNGDGTACARSGF